MAKRIKRTLDPESGSVTFQVMKDGEPVKGQSLTVNPTKDYSAEIQKRMLLHGANAKIGDSAASPEVDAFEALKTTHEALKKGVWAEKAGGGGPKESQTLRVLLRVEANQAKKEGRQPKSRDQISAWFEKLSDEDLKTIRKHAQYVEARNQLKAEDAAAALKNAPKADQALKIG